MNFSVEILRTCPFIRLFRQNSQLNQLYFSGCVLDDLKLEFLYLHDLIQLRETSVRIQNQASKRHVVLAFGQIQVEHFVHFVYLQPGRQQVFVVASLLGDVFQAVVLVLYLTEYLLHDVFQGNDSAGSSELVNHHSQAFFSAARVSA